MWTTHIANGFQGMEAFIREHIPESCCISIAAALNTKIPQPTTYVVGVEFTSTDRPSICISCRDFDEGLRRIVEQYRAYQESK